METAKQLLGDIVAADFRSAAIFSEAGLDFCCGGKKTLQAACAEKGVIEEAILSRIEALSSVPLEPGKNFGEWSLPFLCDYIVNTHHSYVLKSMPQLLAYTKKIADVHGDRHHELLTIADLFAKVCAELTQHMQKEEEVLFPAIKETVATGSKNAAATVRSEITRMAIEHEFAGGTMDKINEISGGYKVPADGCNTYQVTYKLLKQFEDDLHVHVHLENNILFKKALAL
jgi:regulator of cell morphogenesis and NO signaling